MSTKDTLHIKSTSLHSAECSDIVLRTTDTTQLVFRPMLVDNTNDKRAAVKGTFIFRRKGKKNNWEDVQSIPFSSLKKDEGYKLAIKSEELLFLFSELSGLYKLHAQTGIPLGSSEYIRTNQQFAELSTMPQAQVAQFLNANKSVGADLLSKLLTWTVSSGNPTEIVAKFLTLGPDAMKKLNVAFGIQSLKAALSTWKQNQHSSDEEFWQKTLSESSFVLEQVFSWPVSIIKGKAYVGGKTVENTGGSIVDFLMRNDLTQNAALVELKTPCTALLGEKYRQGVYNLSEDLSGATMQVLNYQHTLSENYNSLTGGQGNLFQSFKPKCVVIVGNASQLTDKDRRKSFELFRGQIAGVSIITYDELFAKTEKLINVLELPAKVVTEVSDMPF